MTPPQTPTTAEALRGAGLRVTAARVALLDTVREGDHLGVEAITAGVRDRVGHVSLQAVYEALHALTAAGLIRRLEPAGRFVFACWQGVERNPWHVGTALRPLVPPPRTPAPGKSPVGPFAFGDEEYVRELLEAAGFGAVQVDAHETTVRGPAATVTDPALLGLMGVPPERQDEATALVDAHLARFAVGPDEYEFPLAFWVFEAAAS